MLPETDPRRSAVPELTRREVDVVTALCKPALCDEAFVAPATARDIAADLVVTEAAVKQHLLRLYQKLKIAEGPNRRVRLANEVVARGPRPAAAGGGHARQPGSRAGANAARRTDGRCADGTADSELRAFGDSPCGTGAYRWSQCRSRLPTSATFPDRWPRAG